jgi:hypothetical protein
LDKYIYLILLVQFEVVSMEDKFFTDEELDRVIEDDSIYSEDVREELLEDDEISPMESAFMKGYDEAYV